MTTNCGDATYNGNDNDCRKYDNCEVPLVKDKGNKCTCKSGFSMRKDKTCGLSCLKTPYDGNDTTCTQIENCQPPTGNNTNCSCVTGMIQDRLGQCNTTCGKTVVLPGETYESCTNKIGCRAPNYKTSNDTINRSGKNKTCVCFEEGFGSMNTTTGRCNCHTTAVTTNRGADCLCDFGYIADQRQNPITCKVCPSGTFMDVKNNLTQCNAAVPTGGTIKPDQTGIVCNGSYGYIPAAIQPDGVNGYRAGTCSRCNATQYVQHPPGGSQNKCTICPVNMGANNDRNICDICFSPFLRYTLPNGTYTCKCPPNQYYIDPPPNGHNGSCKSCAINEILPDTSGYKKVCHVCPPNEMPNSRKDKCECQHPFTLNGSNNCVCKAGYYFVPNKMPPVCRQCSNTSYIPTPGLVETCTQCGKDQYSGTDHIQCICLPGFVNESGVCMCSAGYRYSPGTFSKIAECKLCAEDTYLPNNSLLQRCISCGTNAESNTERTSCHCADGTPMTPVGCKEACEKTVYQVAASCRGIKGCTWPKGVFGFCQCDSKRGFAADRKGNCKCKKNYQYDNETETCIALFTASEPITGFLLGFLLIIVLTVIISTLTIIKRKSRAKHLQSESKSKL